MMAAPAYRILIVEDQRDLARAMALAIASLDAPLQVEQVPSGEEALLELRRQPVDILVTDLRLPGMSGLDLVSWVRKHHPETRVFLVTGVEADEAREAAKAMQADAMFRKPLEMADLLDAIERHLGLVESALGAVPEPRPTAESVRQAAQQRLADFLAEQRRALDLMALMLLGEGGRPVLRAGDWPEGVQEERLLSRLLAALSAGVKVARELGQRPPRNVFTFLSPKVALVTVTLAEEYALLALAHPSLSLEQVERVAAGLRGMSGEVRTMLQNMGLIPQTGELSPWEERAEEPVAETLSADDPLGQLLAQPPSLPDPQEAEQFWEDVSQRDEGGLLLPDGLTFEQARALGLVPLDDDDQG